jgi:GNAT superfamily N-acetyltransferase
MSNNFQFYRAQGQAIANFFEDLALLRIAVFREYPYLYEGSLDYERSYLSTYSQAQSSFLFAVYDEGQLIGATTAIALLDETPEVIAPFQNSPYPAEQVFYFGESLLLPAYRGQGLGHRFFDEREAEAKRQGFTWACFCAVVRPDDHPLKPNDYRPLQPFWASRGYLPLGIQTEFSWQDLDKPQADAKPMQFYGKALR